MTAFTAHSSSASAYRAPESYAFATSPVVGAVATRAAQLGAAWAKEAGESGPLAFNRRRLPRKVMKGGAMAIFTRALCAASVVRIELVDGSHTGLGIKSPVPVEIGTSFTLIPDQAMMPRAVGVAVRCELLEDGQYAVGLRTRLGALAA